ncbi:MAG: hypothetical protein ACXVPU_14065 [Bacteroidia bacterium]
MDINLINNLIWEIDDEENILEYKFSSGICIWLVIRYRIYFLLLKKAISVYEAPIIKTASGSGLKKKPDGLKYFFQSFKRRPTAVKQHFECLNVCSSLAFVNGSNGFRSRISGFLNDLPSVGTLNLIKSNEGTYRNAYAGAYCFYDFIFLKEALKRKAGFSNNSSDKKSMAAIEAFMEVIRGKLSDYLDVEDMRIVKQTLVDNSIMMDGMEQSIKKILKKTSPKLLIIEDANYGSFDFCIFIKAARELNIKTAEIQHGVLDIGFKYSSNLIKQDDFPLHKTDYILTFGDYFSESIKSSSTTISIGSYHLELENKRIREASNSLPKTILLITQREFTDNLIPIVLEALRNTASKFKLIIRLHPSDKNSKEKYNGLLEVSDALFSINENIYDLMQEAQYIVGSYSTALYESIYFGKMPFIHINSLSQHFMAKEVGLSFTNPVQLSTLLEEPPPVLNNSAKEYFWKSGCVSNFQAFYQSRIL